MDLVSDRSSFLMTMFSFPVSSKMSVRASSALSKSLHAMMMRAPKKVSATEHKPGQNHITHSSPHTYFNLGEHRTINYLRFACVCSLGWSRAPSRRRKCENSLISFETHISFRLQVSFYTSPPTAIFTAVALCCPNGSISTRNSGVQTIQTSQTQKRQKLCSFAAVQSSRH